VAEAPVAPATPVAAAGIDAHPRYYHWLRSAVFLYSTCYSGHSQRDTLTRDCLTPTLLVYFVIPALCCLLSGQIISLM
jgi:hypothetical protein